jgi:hypothetical protein
MDLFRGFCTLPVDVKKSLPYSNNTDGVGYEYKDGTGISGDRKENFDITTSGKEWLENNKILGKEPIVLDFLSSSMSLVDLTVPLILDFARKCEDQFGLVGFYDEVLASKGGFFFRFIHYFPASENGGKVGEETAQTHVDQSGFTLHLFESDKGLEFLTYDKKWIPMPVGSKETVIIPSMQLQLRSAGELRALAHRVVANEQTEKDGRYSAVCFIQLKNTPKYDKDKWGRLQEMIPGFNYGLSHEEFSKFFK